MIGSVSSLAQGGALPQTPTPPMAEARAEPRTEQRARRFQRALDELREEHGFVGATAAYSLQGGEVRAFATGMADLERGLAMTPHTRLLSGSIGKTFVAAVALDLEREGKLDLDDPVAHWLGQERWYARLPNGRAITVRQLLSHSAGLPDHVYEEEFQLAVAEMGSLALTDPERYLGPVEAISFVLDREPLFAPGEGFSYTDTGFLLAGLVIERAAGSTYYEELQRRFLDPLGLDETSPSNQRKLEGLAVGYLQGSDPVGPGGRPPSRIVDREGALWIHPAIEWTGGGLVTTSRDLVVWARELYEGRAIEGGYLESLLESGYRGAEAEARYGLGVFLYDTPLGPAYGHPGWFPGYNSWVRYYPELGIALAMQVNRDYGVDRSDFAEPLMAALIDEP